MKFALFTLLFPICLFSTSAPKKWDKIISRTRSYWQVPGCSVAIVKDGEVIHCKGYGIKNATEPALGKVNRHTLFSLASMTKLFTSTAIAVMVDRGALEFDHPLINYNNSFLLVSPYATKTLSFRDCLSMRAGLYSSQSQDQQWINSSDTQETLLKKLFSLQLPYGFRGAFYYQNLLYLLVGKTIGQINKTTWGAYIRHTLLDPLEMTDTTSDYYTFKKSSNRATPHQWKDEQFRPVEDENLTLISPAVGLYSNAEEMAKWLLFIQDPTQLDFSETLFKDLLTPQTVVFPKGLFQENDALWAKVFFPGANFLNYGMGWFIHDYRDMKVCQAPGYVDGMTPLMAYIPHLKVGIVILSNAESPYFSHALLFQLIDAFGNWQFDWNDYMRSLQIGREEDD